jgi:hypothetical protein
VTPDIAALTDRRLSSLHAEISFPRGSDYDNITHIKVVISPDEGIYRVCPESFVFCF